MLSVSGTVGAGLAAGEGGVDGLPIAGVGGENWLLAIVVFPGPVGFVCDGATACVVEPVAGVLESCGTFELDCAGLPFSGGVDTDIGGAEEELALVPDCVSIFSRLTAGSGVPFGLAFVLVSRPGAWFGAKFVPGLGAVRSAGGAATGCETAESAFGEAGMLAISLVFSSRIQMVAARAPNTSNAAIPPRIARFAVHEMRRS